ncbi:MAG: large subunit ribosomal protein [Frankiales bacterium]|jgi:large subunit ribosomal protein L4|nr:large subunit ribosomal protein [Frankiales bacterium]
MTTVNVLSPEGEELARTVELPVEVFDVQVNVPLIHQVVVAQLAAARQGTADTKSRGEVRGGGRKPYRQKGTGRARQGSTRAPQFTGGGVVHGPSPRSYAQRTPKKMKAAALRGALSDRARGGRVHVVSGFGVDDTPSTKTAAKALQQISAQRHVLLVVEREDVLTWKSVRNIDRVHILAPDQLNTYDVLVSDDVVFTEGALANFLNRPFEAPAEEKPAKKAAKASKATKATKATKAATATKATDAGTTKPAGEGVSDEEAVKEVAEQTSSDVKAEDVFEREADGATTDTEVAEASADEVEGGEKA